MIRPKTVLVLLAGACPAVLGGAVAPAAADVLPFPAPSATDAAAPPELVTQAAGLSLLSPGMTGSFGGVGLLGMPTALSGAPWQLRVGLHLYGYGQGDLLIHGDYQRSFAGTLQVDATLGRFVELWITMGGSVSQNDRSTGYRVDPHTIANVGDLRFGAKLHGQVARGLHIGLQPLLGMSGGGDHLGPAGSTVGGGADLLASLDVRELQPRVALRVHLLAGYYHDGSSSLLDDDPSYACSNVATQVGCVYSRIAATTGYGVRPSRGRFALGADWPVALGSHVVVSPMAAYHVEVHGGDGDVQIAATLPAVGAATDDRTTRRVGQWIEVGLRLHTTAHLTADLGFLGGISSPGFSYGAQLAQIAGYGALTWTSDLLSRRRRGGASPGASAAEAVEGQPPSDHAATQESGSRWGAGRVHGVVQDQSGARVAGAVLRFLGRRHNPILTDDRGEFEAGPFSAGALTLEVTHNGFERRRVELHVRAGQVTMAEVALLPVPVYPSPVRVDVADERGSAIPALVVALRNRQALEVPPDINGGFQREVPAGTWRLRVDSEGFLSRELPVQLAPGTAHRSTVILRRRPSSPSVRLGGDNLVLKTNVIFEVGTAVLTPRSAAVLDEIVDILVWHPEISKLRIEGHTDQSGQPLLNQQLSEERAMTVRNYLIKQGIAPERLVAEGFGSSQPLIAEGSVQARSQNRRVAFRILERTPAK